MATSEILILSPCASLTWPLDYLTVNRRQIFLWHFWNTSRILLDLLPYFTAYLKVHTTSPDSSTPTLLLRLPKISLHFEDTTPILLHLFCYLSSTPKPLPASLHLLPNLTPQLILPSTLQQFYYIYPQIYCQFPPVCPITILPSPPLNPIHHPGVRLGIFVWWREAQY